MDAIRFFSNHSIGLRLGKLVDLGRVDAGVDRPGHQRHAARLRRIVALRHHRAATSAATQGWHTATHMRARPDLFQEPDQVRRHIRRSRSGRAAVRDVARVVPVGDVDVVLGQHGAHGAAQQRGEMARTAARPAARAAARCSMSFLKCSSVPNGVTCGGFLGDRHLAVADRDAVDAVRRARMGQAGARDQLVGGGEVAERRRPHAEPLSCCRTVVAAMPANARTGTMMSECA